jgi:hypothetical protein
MLAGGRSDRDRSRDRGVQHAEPLRGSWPRPDPHHGQAGAKADYFPLSKLRTGLPNGNGLPPTDTMAVPR